MQTSSFSSALKSSPATVVAINLPPFRLHFQQLFPYLILSLKFPNTNIFVGKCRSNCILLDKIFSTLLTAPCCVLLLMWLLLMVILFKLILFFSSLEAEGSTYSKCTTFLSFNGCTHLVFNCETSHCIFRTLEEALASPCNSCIMQLHGSSQDLCRTSPARHLLAIFHSLFDLIGSSESPPSI
jgi:hypothetical protein